MRFGGRSVSTGFIVYDGVRSWRSRGYSDAVVITEDELLNKAGVLPGLSGGFICALLVLTAIYNSPLGDVAKILTSVVSFLSAFALGYIIGSICTFRFIKGASNARMYHAAEHKTIFLTMNGLAPTVENFSRCPKNNQFCGTSLVADVFCLPFFACLWWITVLWVESFFALLPLVVVVLALLVAGKILSYKGHCNLGLMAAILSIVGLPGIILQQLMTIKEPNDEIIQEAIAVARAIQPYMNQVAIA